MKLLFVLTLAALLAGCASHFKTVKSRAAFDLDCPEERVGVQELGGGGYGARGCGRQTSYYCEGLWWGAVSRCAKDSENLNHQ